MTASPAVSGPQPILVVSGPTAIGKSGLAVRLAHSLNAEIVSLDATQIYRGADIGSAKITISEQQGVPHHLLDALDPDQQCNVSDYLKKARSAIKAIQDRGKLALVVGGSNLYLTGLLHGLAELPAATPELRAELTALTTEELLKELQICDPLSAERIKPNDRLRLQRALEVFRVTGRPQSAIVAEHDFRGAEYQALILLLVEDRTALYERIDQRVINMLEAGLIEETRQLRDRFGATAPVLKSLGYSQALDFLEGRLPEGELAAQIAQGTRRFAKRQATFWKNEPAKRGWSEAPERTNTPRLKDCPTEADPELPAFNLNFEQLSAAVQAHLKKTIPCIQIWRIAAPNLR